MTTTRSSLSLSDILPTPHGSLNGACFVFGAGASMEAGYPMMPALTRYVVDSLSHNDKSTLNEILDSSGNTYDDTNATPNIEEISDIIISHAINSGSAKHQALEETIRRLVVRKIRSVEKPELDNHISFLRNLKARSFGQNSCVWIITTNYDLLFEIAASHAQVHLVNGFCGTTIRYFDHTKFDQVVGQEVAAGGGSRRFLHAPQLTVKIVKLHGSLSWFNSSGSLFETHPDVIDQAFSRAMILPRKKKIVETLAYPYDQLFGRASKAIGNECKFIVSCGFSFGDDHINDNLFIPPLTSAKARITVLSKEEPKGIAKFKDLPTFNAGFDDFQIRKGVVTSGGTDLWKFSNFVHLFG